MAEGFFVCAIVVTQTHDFNIRKLSFDVSKRPLHSLHTRESKSTIIQYVNIITQSLIKIIIMGYSLAYHYTCTCNMAQSHSLTHHENMAKRNSHCYSIKMLFYLLKQTFLFGVSLHKLEVVCHWYSSW